MDKARFTEQDGWKSEESAAFRSLRSALYAYFETYRATFVNLYNPTNFSDICRKERFENELYKSLYFTIITQFQNFFELLFKDILNRIETDKSHIKTKNFSDTLKKLEKILQTKDEKLMVRKIKFIIDKKETLKKLNDLRNRIWHRGLFYLYYCNLDLLVCQDILPLIKKITALDWYSKKNNWRYNPLVCDIEPIESLIFEGNSSSPDFERIALYKEMGRAAYNNPMANLDKIKSMLSYSLERSNNERKSRLFTEKAEMVCKAFSCSDVFICPICGLKTLVKYEEDDLEDDENCAVVKHIPKKIECEACSFEIYPNIRKLSLCRINDNDFWNIR